MSISLRKFLSSNDILLRVALALAVAGIISSLPIYAQTAASLATPESNSATPAVTASNDPAEPHTAFWHLKERKLEALANSGKIDAKVTSGLLTVDGFVAKVELNYDIHHTKYMYFFAPGIGTAVVSRLQMPGAVKIKDAIHGSSIAFSINGHSFALDNDMVVASSAEAIENPAVKAKKEKSKEVHDAYVLLDDSAQALYRSPQVGYGNTNVAPYVFPLSDAEPKDNYAHFVQPPPMPSNVLPRTKATQTGGTGGK